MKLLFRQKFFSWFDSYDVYDEYRNTVFTVKGQLAWGHCQKIMNAGGEELGMVKEKVLTFLPKFEIYRGNQYLGRISKEFTLFRPKFDIDFNGWHMEGNIFGWDYRILDRNGSLIATVTKELFNFTDTYSIDVVRSEDAFCALALVVAIDAEKCSRSNN